MATREELLNQAVGDLFDLNNRVLHSTEAIRSVLGPFLAAWDAAAPIHTPTPYEIAMAFGVALASSGRLDNLPACMTQAWAAVPEFYKARDWYLTEFAPMRMGQIAMPTGGETDDSSGEI